MDLHWKNFTKAAKNKALIKALITKRKKDPAERPMGYTPDALNVYYRQAPLIGPALDDLVDSICGAGINIQVTDIESGEEVPYTDVPEFAAVLRASRINKVIYSAIHDSYRVGNGYIVKKYKGNSIHKVDIAVPNEMRVDRDKYGNVNRYYQEIGSEEDWAKFTPDEIVHIKMKSVTGDAYGFSIIERVAENADVMRDVGLDFSKFLATKAYPPTVWQFGTPEHPWSDADIEKFMNSLEDIDPSAQIGVRGDVEAKTLNPEAQMPDVSPIMTLFTSQILNGIGTPAVSSGLINDTGLTGDIQEKSYNRRVNTARTMIGEQLELELFDEILVSNGYDDLMSTVTWNRHSDEENRMLVNDLVQLGQNGFMTREFGQMLLGFPSGDNMPGEYIKEIGQAALDQMQQAGNGTKLASPAIPAQADQNTTKDLKALARSDGRKGSKRMNV